MNIFQKAILFLTDPAEYYAEKTRERFYKLYEARIIDYVPQITGSLDENGDVTVTIRWIPPWARFPKDSAIDSPIDNQ